MFTPNVCRLRNVDGHKPSHGINASVNLYMYIDLLVNIFQSKLL